MYPRDYLINQFKNAIILLATGEGDARSRVRQAYSCFWHIPLENYPEYLRQEVSKLTDMLTRVKSREMYVIPDKLQNMKNKTASKIAHQIVSIYFKLNSLS